MCIFTIALIHTEAPAKSVNLPASRVAAGIQGALSLLDPTSLWLDEIPLEEGIKLLNLTKLDREASAGQQYEATSEPGKLFFARVALYNRKIIKKTDGSRLIALTNNQISSDLHATLGRYAVWLLPDRSSSVSWENEETMKIFFREAGLSLPDNGIWKQPDGIDWWDKMQMAAPSRQFDSRNAIEDAKANRSTESPTNSKEQLMPLIADKSEIIPKNLEQFRSRKLVILLCFGVVLLVGLYWARHRLLRKPHV